MPIIVKCVCGEVLHVEKGSNLGYEYMQNLVKSYNGKCPRCNRALTLPPRTVTVKPYHLGGKVAGSSQLFPLHQGGYADHKGVSAKQVEVGPGVPSPPAASL